MVLGDDGRCPLAILLPFTDRGKESKQRSVQTAFTHMASALMAMEDFNDRDASVVPRLADEEFGLDRCSVYFPLPWDDDNGDDGDGGRFASVISDDGGREDVTANALLSTLSRMRLSSSNSDGDDYGEYDARKNHGLCAVAGTVDGLPARTAATLAAASDVPYLSHAADTTKISRPPIYPLAGKVGPDEYARGDAVISYLKSIGRDKVVLMYSHTNEDVLKVTSKAAKDHGVELRYEPVGPPWDGKGADTIHDAVRRIKESGFKTVIVQVSRLYHYEHVAREAEHWGANAEDYVWFNYETGIDLEALAGIRTSKGSETDKLLRAMGSVRVLDGYDWQEDNKFLSSWKGRDASFVERLNSINPIKKGKKKGGRLLQAAGGGSTANVGGAGGTGSGGGSGSGGGGGGGAPKAPKPTAGYFLAEPDYFQTHLPQPFSSFMYDTVIALGMGACRTQKIMRERQEMMGVGSQEIVDADRGDDQAVNPDSSSLFEVGGDGTVRRLQGGSYISRPGKNLQYNETVKVSFDGASGLVRLDNGMIFSRDESTIGFGTYNFRPVDNLPPPKDAPENSRGYEYVLTSMQAPGKPWAGVSGQQFIYADGTTTMPTPVREVFENNYLSPEVRAAGLSLFAIGAFVCLSLAGWTFTKRKKTIVRAAQPEFLYMIIFGSFESLVAIIMLSFDESYGTSVETLSRMCTATPWLFFTGYIIVYMALFSKLKRIDSVLSFRRRQVKIRHVIAPAIAMVFAALVILTLWTALDPWVWVRETVDEMTGETFGKCESNNGLAYVIPLVVLMVIATTFAAVMAWKTKDIASRYGEGATMFVAIVTQLEVWFIGIPILVIVDNVSAEATYLGRVLIIWTFAVTMVGAMIGSKCLYSYGYCLPSSENTNSRGSVAVGSVRVSGLNLPASALNGSGRAAGNVPESARIVTAEKAVLSHASKASTALTSEASTRKSSPDIGDNMAEADLAHNTKAPPRELASDNKAKDDWNDNTKDGNV